MKKWYLVTLVILLLSAFLALCVNADTEASSLGYACYIDNDETDYSDDITDNSYTTRVEVRVGERLKFDISDRSFPAASVYIKFYGEPPQGGYVLKAVEVSGDTTAIECGENNYLHELVNIPVGTIYVIIEASSDFELCEAEIFSTGTLPWRVQRWESTLDECDLLVISAHSDDDTLFFGPLIAENIAKYRSVQTAVMSNHDTELHRRNELLDGQWELGLTAYPIIGEFPDKYSTNLNAARNNYRAYDVLGFIVEIIRKTKPSVVVTHDFDGEYGHGAHMLVADLTAQALDHVANVDEYVESAELYGVHMPSKVYIHNYEENKILLDVELLYDSLDLKSPFEVAKDAYKHHTSQQHWDYEVTQKGKNDCRAFGLFYANVECDVTSNDVMNGVDLIKPEVSSPTDFSEFADMATKADVMVKHLDTEQHEMFGVLYEDSNGKPTRAPTGAVAFCITVLILFLGYVFVTLVRDKHKKI